MEKDESGPGLDEGHGDSTKGHARGDWRLALVQEGGHGGAVSVDGCCVARAARKTCLLLQRPLLTQAALCSREVSSSQGSAPIEWLAAIRFTMGT